MVFTYNGLYPNSGLEMGVWLYGAYVVLVLFLLLFRCY